MSGERAPLPLRAVEVLRDEGPRGLWWRSLGLTVYRRLVVFARDMDEPPSSPSAPLQLSLDFLEVGDLDDYLELRPGMQATEVERRLRTGQHCLLARDEGRVVSSRWVATGRAEMPYIDHHFELPEGVAYVYDAYTAPDTRRRGIGGQLRRRYEVELRRRGTRMLLVTVMPQNAAGLGLVAAAGYTPVGRIGCVRLPGLRLLIPRIPPGYLGPARRLRV